MTCSVSPSNTTKQSRRLHQTARMTCGSSSYWRRSGRLLRSYETCSRLVVFAWLWTHDLIIVVDINVNDDQILKDATLYFSCGTPNLATVLPAMDHIDMVFTNATLWISKNHPAVHAAIQTAKHTLNKYYSLTDASELYWIMISLYIFLYYSPTDINMPVLCSLTPLSQAGLLWGCWMGSGLDWHCQGTHSGAIWSKVFLTSNRRRWRCWRYPKCSGSSTLQFLFVWVFFHFISRLNLWKTYLIISLHLLPSMVAQVSSTSWICILVPTQKTFRMQSNGGMRSAKPFPDFTTWHLTTFKFQV